MVCLYIILKVFYIVFRIWCIGCNCWDGYHNIYPQIIGYFKFAPGVIAFVVECRKII